jgi:hypothetical protein
MKKFKKEWINGIRIAWRLMLLGFFVTVIYQFGAIAAKLLVGAIEIESIKEDPFLFAGKQVNLKTDTGWLVGFDNGEWGGKLYWFNEDGTYNEKILRGNIKNIFRIPTASSVLILTHFLLAFAFKKSNGQIHRI